MWSCRQTSSALVRFGVVSGPLCMTLPGLPLTPPYSHPYPLIVTIDRITVRYYRPGLLFGAGVPLQLAGGAPREHEWRSISPPTRMAGTPRYER